MPENHYWFIFFASNLALCLSPGPDLIYILSRSITQGTKVGVASALGVCSGALVHVLAAAFGVSALLATSAMAFAIVKYVGAAYLLYLGIKALRSKGSNLTIPQEKVLAITPWQAFQQGVMVDVLNPKVALFFMAFLPQFIRPQHGPTALQLLTLGFLVVVTAIIVEVSFALAAARATQFFRARPGISRWLDRALGSILIGLGIRLALTRQNP